MQVTAMLTLFVVFIVYYTKGKTLSFQNRSTSYHFANTRLSPLSETIIGASFEKFHSFPNVYKSAVEAMAGIVGCAVAVQKWCSFEESDM